MPVTSVASQLEHFLSLTNKRETVIASNMANIDTPGYHTQDFNFGHALSQVMTSENSDTEKVDVTKVRGLLERPDGNNVDLDRESTLLAESQLNYQLGTQLLKSRFHQLLAAINGGGTGA